MEKEFEFMQYKIKSNIGGDSIKEMYLTVEPKKKRTQVCVSLELIERFKIEDIEKANKLYEQIENICYGLKGLVK